ncbi:hypothetical protein RHGRI_013174 [Rhododendron griersonianum]|uniref:Aminopeptidase NAALADL1 n=1 Tax=Rhododendron griersonianum TaxID=479676 RepID=A0AAV6K4W1_9ERIC|nr:hypothetical protein RHGRI_013174 [Rhododendron griersonianum]
MKTATITFIAIATSLSIFSSASKTSYHNLFISTSDNASISQHLFTLTRRPHVAGSQANAEAAAYVLSTLDSYDIPSHIASYDVLLTYPVLRSLTLTRPPPDSPTTFDLRQEIYNGDLYADVADEVLPTFHAYAKSGTVSGPAVYVNYGRVEDYAILKGMGVNVSGTVALARYGQIFRGNIVENAYDAGVVIYTDRKDYGGGGGGVKWFPDEKWMPPSGVQVGSVFRGTGDPTTPGWPSTGTCERLSDDEVEQRDDVPHIPSLPISWADGDAIMRSIGGLVAKDDWQGGIDAPVYRVGPGPGIIELSYTHCTIENVIGIIEGAEEPDRFSLGMKVAQRLGKLQKRGWKPRRTIVFCNWDAEEYGLIGSTEWVEENREMIASRVVAYLNVDIAAQAAGFHASATPQLDELLKQATQQVQDPDNSSQTIYEAWVGSSKSNESMIGRLGGGGSDYAAFVQHIGVPSVDMSFGKGYPVYHSMYDDFTWMKKFGDPMFHRHVAAASVWGLVALKLADEELLPFNYLSYSHELQALEENKGWESIWKKDPQKVREWNDRLMMAERAFIDQDGLSGRPWSKHMIYAPSKHNNYGSKSFPGVDDAIEKATSLNTAESWRLIQHEVWRVSRAVTHVSLVLNGKFT